MGYREEAIECVKDEILPLHKKLYDKYQGNFDNIYTHEFNNEFYMGKVIQPGKVYELSYLECTCPMVKNGLIKNPKHCECSRQSIIYILSQLEPKNIFEVQTINTILQGDDRCTFRITKCN